MTYHRYLPSILLPLCLLVTFSKAGAGEPAAPETALLESARPVQKVEDQTRLVNAVAAFFTEATKKPNFWLNIANDDHYPRFQRRRCILEFFHRFVRPGMSLEQLKLLLRHPKWLLPKYLTVMTEITGYVPVEVNVDDSIFCLEVLPSKTAAFLPIYFRLHGLISQHELISCLCGNGAHNLCKVRIAEIGYDEENASLWHSRIFSQDQLLKLMRQ